MTLYKPRFCKEGFYRPASFKVFSAALAIFFLVSTCPIPVSGKLNSGKNSPLKRKIVVFSDKRVLKQTKLNTPSFDAGEIGNLDFLQAKIVELSEEKAEALRNLPGVEAVFDDPQISIQTRSLKKISMKKLRGKSNGKQDSAEVIPWGISKINAPQVWEKTEGQKVKVAILDTGVDSKHPDLKDNIRGGVNLVGRSRSFQDKNGHGTSVAGIIAAQKNSSGIVGAAPQVEIYAVKILDEKGKGRLSDLLRGLEWCLKNKIQIVNLSIGTPSDISLLRKEIKRLASSGISIISAAGNTKGNLLYPAAYEEVIAVSALDEDSRVTSWSSHGSRVDLSAPGTNIISTYKNHFYAAMSGTSAAAPHVTGAAALSLSLKTCDTDQNGSCSPEELKAKLQNSAQDLGSPGKDEFYGFGLIDAAKLSQ